MVYPYQDNNLTALLAQHMGPVPMQQPATQTVAPVQGMASSLAQNPNFIGMLAGLGASLAPAGARYDWMRSLGGTVAGMNKNKAYGEQLATAMGKPKPSGLGTLLQSPQEQLATAELTSRADDRKANQDMHQQELQLSKDKMVEDRTARAEDRQFSRSMLTEKQQFEMGQAQKEFDQRMQLAEKQHQFTLNEIAARPDPANLPLFDSTTGMLIDRMAGKATPIAGYTPAATNDLTKMTDMQFERALIGDLVNPTITQNAGISSPSSWEPNAAIGAATDKTVKAAMQKRIDIGYRLINEAGMKPYQAISTVRSMPVEQLDNYLQNLKTGGKTTSPESPAKTTAAPASLDSQIDSWMKKGKGIQ